MSNQTITTAVTVTAKDVLNLDAAYYCDPATNTMSFSFDLDQHQGISMILLRSILKCYGDYEIIGQSEYVNDEIHNAYGSSMTWAIYHTNLPKDLFVEVIGKNVGIDDLSAIEDELVQVDFIDAPTHSDDIDTPELKICYDSEWGEEDDVIKLKLNFLTDLDDEDEQNDEDNDIILKIPDEDEDEDTNLNFIDQIDNYSDMLSAEKMYISEIYSQHNVGNTHVICYNAAKDINNGYDVIYISENEDKSLEEIIKYIVSKNNFKHFSGKKFHCQTVYSLSSDDAVRIINDYVKLIDNDKIIIYIEGYNEIEANILHKSIKEKVNKIYIIKSYPLVPRYKDIRDECDNSNINAVYLYEKKDDDCIYYDCLINKRSGYTGGVHIELSKIFKTEG